MSDEDVVTDDPGFFTGVADEVAAAVGGAAWGEGAGAVAEDGTAVGLVEGDPVADFRECCEAHAGVMFKVGDEFVLVEETAVSFFKVVGKVPVKKCDHRDNAGVEEIIDELDIVVDTCLGDAVFPSA